MVWTDMQLGPVWSPRPDVWTLRKSYADPDPRAYECKVSVADFRADITSGKWQSYLTYSRAVTFATPAGLIDKKDLPAGCGLMIWNGEYWHTVKAPTLNVRPSIPHDAMMKLLIDGIERAEEASRIRLRDKWHTEASIRQAYGQKVAEYVRDKLTLDDRIASLRKMYEDERHRLEQQEASRRKASEDERDAILSDVREILGLHVGSGEWEIKRKIRELAESVSRDAEVRALQFRLLAFEDAIAKAKETPNSTLLRRYSKKTA